MDIRAKFAKIVKAKNKGRKRMAPIPLEILAAARSLEHSRYAKKGWARIGKEGRAHRNQIMNAARLAKRARIKQEQVAKAAIERESDDESKGQE